MTLRNINSKFCTFTNNVPFLLLLHVSFFFFFFMFSFISYFKTLSHKIYFFYPFMQFQPFYYYYFILLLLFIIIILFFFILLCSPKNFGGAYSRRFVRASVRPCVRASVRPCVRPALVHANSRKLLVGFQ